MGGVVRTSTGSGTVVARQRHPNQARTSNAVSITNRNIHRPQGRRHHRVGNAGGTTGGGGGGGEMPVM